MNTGVQRSSATPIGAWTTTTPGARVKDQPKKDMLAIMAAHRIPYAATATIAFPDDLASKVAKARSIKGTRFLHILAPCPPGWKIASEKVIKAARLAVMSRVFPLVEVERGEEWRITLDPGQVPLEDYLEEQGRFRFLLDQPEALEAAREAVEQRWRQMVGRTGRSLCG
jgi:pyruvate/2-oxoacid:ferredoxin oxidoreductase beta subunit